MNFLLYFFWFFNLWFNVGFVFLFLNIDFEVDSVDFLQFRELKCEGGLLRVLGCKVFSIFCEDGVRGKEVIVQFGVLEWDEDDENKEDLKDQVMIFCYCGKFFVVDYVCLLFEFCLLFCNCFVVVDVDCLWQKCLYVFFLFFKGVLFDIEDFGVKLSMGLMCLKYGWLFDFIIGMLDRVVYCLMVWEV